jgi:hypothetical protein
MSIIEHALITLAFAVPVAFLATWGLWVLGQLLDWHGPRGLRH